MGTKRQTTNTYIPSFELPAALVADAQKLVPAKYKGLIAVDPQTNKAMVKIYETSMIDLSKVFSDATAYGIIYQPAMVKTTLVTMSDATQFKKRTASNGKDKGEYAAKLAKIEFAKEIGCAETIAPYPDIDGSDRVGRPTVITTTTNRYYAPPPIGVVGSSHHTCLSCGILVGALVVSLAAFS